MKTSHSEGRIALSAKESAQGRDEPTQRELAAFDFDFGGAWLVAPADRPGTGDQPGDGRKYLRLARSKPAISTPGSTSDPAAKPAILTLGSEGEPDPKPAIWTAGSGRQSSCLAWLPQVEGAVAVGLSAQRIYQDLVGEHGFSGSYQAVKRFVRQLRQTQPVPFVRMEVEPGAEAQVDFGLGAWVLVDGKRKRPHLFRIVLSHSRKGYSEVVWRQTTESFIR